MRKNTFSIRALLGAIAVAALFCAAYANPNRFLAFICQSLVLLLLFYSTTASVYCDAVRRAFWVGFAVFGWGAFLLRHGSVIDYFESTIEVLAYTAQVFRVSVSSSHAQIADCIFVSSFAMIGAVLTQRIFYGRLNARRE